MPAGPSTIAAYTYSLPPAQFGGVAVISPTASSTAVHGVTSRTPSSFVSRSWPSLPENPETSMWVTLSEFSKFIASSAS